MTAVISLTVFAETENQNHSESAEHAHEENDCSLCHRLVASLEDAGGNPDFSPRCLSCHGRDETYLGSAAGVFHQDRNRPCGSCHLYHQPPAIMAHGQTFTFTGSDEDTSCRTCHASPYGTANLSAGHQLAAQVFHNDHPALLALTESEKCLVCHSEERGTVIAGLSVMNVPRFSEQHMHPIGEVKTALRSDGQMPLRETFDSRLQLNRGRIECTTCHSLTSVGRHRLVEFDSPRDLCLGCHDYQ